MVHETQRVGLVLPSLGRLNQRGDSQETAVEQVTSPPCLESYLVIRTLLSKTKPDHPKGRRSQVRAGARGTETLCRVGECAFTQPRRGAAWSVVQTCPQNGTARDPETSLLGPHAEETQSLSGKQLATAWSRQPIHNRRDVDTTSSPCREGEAAHVRSLGQDREGNAAAPASTEGGTQGHCESRTQHGAKSLTRGTGKSRTQGPGARRRAAG